MFIVPCTFPFVKHRIRFFRKKCVPKLRRGAPALLFFDFLRPVQPRAENLLLQNGVGKGDQLLGRQLWIIPAKATT